MQLIEFLANSSAGGGGGRGVSVSTVIISLIGSLIVAAGAGWAKLATERTARRSESQRVALYALQDGALEFRQAVEAFGNGTEADPDVLADKTRALDLASGRLDILRDRVKDIHATRFTTDWKRLAERFFAGSSETPQHREQLAWDYMCGAIKTALRNNDA